MTGRAALLNRVFHTGEGAIFTLFTFIPFASRVFVKKKGTFDQVAISEESPLVKTITSFTLFIGPQFTKSLGMADNGKNGIFTPLIS